jgi:ribosomal protein S18 acetylase RimI-like enzyme
VPGQGPDPLLIEPLAPQHNRASFSCGEPALDAYLRHHASQDVRRRLARVFILTGNAPSEIVGYYSLAATSFVREALPEVQARRLPNYPVPSAILGRLAVDLRYQGRRHGETLLLDAVRRVIRASSAVAIHAVVVDAKNDRAARFYAHYGFRPFVSDARRLFLPLDTFVKAGLS